MTLKEKFSDKILVPLSNQGFYIDWDKVEQCEKLADEFAIEFAEWLMDSHVSELTLKIFKKEKGL